MGGTHRDPRSRLLPLPCPLPAPLSCPCSSQCEAGMPGDLQQADVSTRRGLFRAPQRDVGVLLLCQRGGEGSCGAPGAPGWSCPRSVPQFPSLWNGCVPQAVPDPARANPGRAERGTGRVLGRCPPSPLPPPCPHREEVLPKLHSDPDYPCDLVGNWNTWYGEQDQAGEGGQHLPLPFRGDFGALLPFPTPNPSFQCTCGASRGGTRLSWTA